MRDYNKKVDKTIKIFIDKCIDDPLKMFNFKKLYFSIRKCIIKIDVQKVEILYNYAISLKNRKIMTLTEFFKEAEGYRKEQITNHQKSLEKELKIKKTKAFSLADLKGL